MTETFDKILAAQFTTDHVRGLVWVETWETDDGDNPYQIWLLVEKKTDRMLASIDGPTKKQICYTVAVEGNGGLRRYLSLDGAKKNALSVAMQILGDGWRDSAERRKARHVQRAGKG